MKKSKKIIIILLLIPILVILLAILFLLPRDTSTVKTNTVTVETEDTKTENETESETVITGDQLEEIKIVKTTDSEDEKETYEKTFHYGVQFRPVKAWIRARLIYEKDDAIKELGDHLVTFDSYLWRRADDGWYYYREPVESGDTVRFIRGIQLPYDWSNKTKNKEFSIKVEVEAAEVQDGDKEWDRNSRLAYHQTYDFWTTTDRTELKEPIRNGHMTVTIIETQKNLDGSVVPYENDKLVVPGQYISKIVDFQLNRLIIRNTGDACMLGLYAAGITIPLALLIFLVSKKKSKTET